MKKDKINDVAELDKQEISAFLAAAYDVLKLISDAFPDGKLPIRVGSKKIITGSQVREENEDVLDNNFYCNIDSWVERYSKLESVSNYLRFMFKNRLIEMPVFSDKSGEKLHYDLDKTVDAYISGSDSLVVYPIVDILKRNLKLECTEDELIESYHRYLNPKKAPTYYRIMNTPLIGFESELPFFSFSDEFSIQIFSDRHKNAYSKLSDYGFINQYTLSEIRYITHMIQWKKEIYKTQPSQYEHEKYLYLLIMSIRLCTSSDVVGKSSLSEPQDIISMVGVSGNWHFETSKPWQFDKSHKFEETDLLNIKIMFEELLKLDGKSGYKNIFNVVLKRYLSSLSRTSPEDSVIDFTICLESLLLANERDELKFRLTLRGANLLVDDDPTLTKKILGRMYDDRSKIVHNGETLNGIRRGNQIDILGEYRFITEKIIRAYIEKSSSFTGINQVNEFLDAQCFSAAKSQKARGI